ncbi:hypothetical protein [Snuella sedimenti]|uniref:Uncharacterized protein n=1 Tax=Snuella sedimenti TaxID=2798802 RepID=A0A8J7IGN1_9FLAO|nr:hypothetical protein [Snuella sedimenti]MBJ6367803.1 hypothetical protein [Snuella sedimenti]
MSFYNFLLCCFLGLFHFQQKQFVSIEEDRIKINRDNTIITIMIPFKILDGYHIQALSNTQDNLIPTEINFEVPEGCTLQKTFTKKYYDTVVLDKVEHKALSHILEVTVTLKCDKRMPSDSSYLNGGLYYQTCNDRQCFFPRTLDFCISY